jgi:REase_DpnII-MboI
MVPLSRAEVNIAIAGIRNSLAQADKTASRWEAFLSSKTSIDPLEVAIVDHYVELAFIQASILLEAVGLPEALNAVQRLHRLARKNYSRTTYAEGLYLVWPEKLGHYLDAIENSVGGQNVGTVTKDVIEILRGTLYAITDSRCFTHPPYDERDVHVRIEAVLRCVFTDLRHKPPISKPIKNLEPDTGLPSLRALIEYKYVSTLDEAKAISDQVLADTRGYTSKDWGSFIYVIYETSRIKREEERIQHLRESGVAMTQELLFFQGNLHRDPK